MNLSLAPQVFAILSAFVEERVGLSYRLEDSDLFAAKVGARAMEAGFESLLDYYYFLRYDDPEGRELQALVEALVVHESYFFREHDQLTRMVDEVLVPRVAERGRARVWSAACASGEEPYTVAMMLADRGLLDRVDIVASDVSAKSLASARRGELSSRALRDVPEPQLAARWLERDGRILRVSPRIRRAVELRQVNLLDEQAVRAQGTFDVILCRNVLIYFSDRTVRQVATSLSGQLAPGGSLWIGVSESLLRAGTGLVCEERKGVFYYRRPS